MNVSYKAIETVLDATTIEEVKYLLSNHDELIRQLARYVLEGKAGNDKVREAAIGSFYNEVQDKVTWTVRTAEEVWANVYGTGEARRAALGADFDLVMFRVNQTRAKHEKIFISPNLKAKTDMNGKRYVVSGVSTSKGTVNFIGYPQGAQGANKYNIKGSGCGASAIVGAIATAKGYTTTLVDYLDNNLTAVGGTVCPISTAIAEKLLDREAISYKRVKSFTTDSLTEILRKHLWTGNPVFVSLRRYSRSGADHKGRYAGAEHYALLIGCTEDGKKGYLLDSSRDTNRPPRYVDLHDLADHVPTAREKETYSPIWNGWSNCGGVLLITMI